MNDNEPMATAGERTELRGTSRFEIVRQLGAGGMGLVYEAIDREHNERIAIKTLQHLNGQALYLFKNEFRALYDLEHPNLVGLGELFEDDGQWFFTMELIDGVDFVSYVRMPAPGSADERPGEAGIPLCRPIQSHMARRNMGDATMSLPGARLAHGSPHGNEPMAWPAGAMASGADEQRLRSGLTQLALGLVALHDAGLVHRDVKPSNVLVQPSGHVTVLDFGLVSAASTTLAGLESRLIGTPAYMAPEQAISGAVGPAADWYAVGVMLFKAWTGRLPYDGAHDHIIEAKQRFDAPAPSLFVPGMPDDLEQLCMDLLRREPAERPTGADVLARLGEARTAGSAARRHPQARRAASAKPVFVGRRAELAVLRRAFAETRNGGAVSAYVCGESGVGKSALVRRFTESIAALGHDTVVLTGRCYQNEAVSYNGFDGLVDELSVFLRGLSGAAAELIPDSAGLLAQVFPVLGCVEHIARASRELAAPKDPHELRRQAFQSLRELIARIARRYLLVLAIEDMQWVAPDSLLLLGDIMRPPAAPPLLLLMTSRQTRRAKPSLEPALGPPPGQSSDQRPDSASVDSVLAFAHPAHPARVRIIELGVLPPDTACELARELMQQAGFEHGLSAEQIVTESRGHPLYIDALIRHATLSGGHTATSLRLDEMLSARLATLPPAATRIIELVAIAGARLPQALIRQAAELGPTEFSKNTAFLRANHLVRIDGVRQTDMIEPYHDRVRESISTRLDSARRVHCHRRLALVCELQGMAATHPELLFWHCRAAGETQRAAGYAAQAARAAAQALAFEHAAELYRQALILGDHRGGELRALQLALADALASAGHGNEAAEVYLEAAEGADPPLRRDCLRRAALLWLVAGNQEQGLATMTLVLHDIGCRVPATPWGTIATLLWQRTRLRVRGIHWTARSEPDIAAGELARLDSLRAAGEGLSMSDPVRGAVFQTRTLLLALHLGEPSRLARSLAWEGVYMAARGGKAVRRADLLLERAQALALECDQPEPRAIVTLARGMATHLTAQFRRAARLLRDAELTYCHRIAGNTAELTTIRVFLVGALRELGAFRECQERAGGYILDAVRRSDLYVESSLRRLCSLLHLVSDQPGEAHDSLAHASWQPPGGGYHLQHWQDLQARAELALYEGEVVARYPELSAGFARLERSLLFRFQFMRAVALSVRGRVLMAMAAATCKREPSASKRYAREAARIARRIERDRDDVRYAEAWALVLRASIAALQGDVDSAVRALTRAAELADKAEVLPWAAAARWRKGMLIGGDEGRALVAEADAWMADEGVQEPGRLVEVFAPGFAGG